MTHTDLGSRILKVDHAGEFGAMAIYTGQIFMARMFARDLVSELVEFRDHERGHRAIFAAELKRRVRPRCRSYALCGMGGFILGLTGLMGRAAISVTTVAVERVVLRHLREQMIQLRGVDDEAVAAISAIVAEEQMHHDRASTRLPVMRPWHRMLATVVSVATESIIWLGMKL